MLSAGQQCGEGHCTLQITEHMPYSIFCNVICDITLYEEHDNLRLIHLFAPGWLFGFSGYKVEHVLNAYYCLHNIHSKSFEHALNFFPISML